MYTAILKDWCGIFDQGQFRLSGKVYADAKRRVEDGTIIVTSPVDAIEDTVVGKIAVVSNGTRYLLVG